MAIAPKVLVVFLDRLRDVAQAIGGDSEYRFVLFHREFEDWGREKRRILPSARFWRVPEASNLTELETLAQFQQTVFPARRAPEVAPAQGMKAHLPIFSPRHARSALDNR
jgi:hypothetical protein